MKRAIYLTIALVMLLGTSLSACYLEDTCSPDELYAPSNLSPNDDLNPLDTVIPQLSWSYPEGCAPESFTVELFTGLRWAGEHELAYHTEVDGTERTVVVGPLTPGTHYSWIVYPMSDGEEGMAGWGSFIIGSWCTEADRALYTPPILVSPAEGEVISHTTTIGVTHEDGSETSFTAPWFTFTWRNSMTCLPPEGFTLEYSENPRFAGSGPATHRIHASDGTTIYDFLWDMENTRWYECMRIYWRVLVGEYEYSDDPYANVYAVSETNSFIINTTGTFCMPDFGLILTPIPWFDLPLPADTPTATTLEAANCRSGPTTEYPVLDILPAGAQLPIQGRNPAVDSWLVEDAIINQTCWVYGEMVETSGDTSLVPIIEAELLLPTPTDTLVTPFNCSQFTGLTCEADNHPCRWTGNVCVNK